MPTSPSTMSGASHAPLVSYSFEGGIATLSMDDGKANVMSVHMLQALNEALDKALADKAVVLLTGRAGMFSGGFDLGVFKRDKAELVQMLEAGARITERLLSFPRPVVMACTGHAIAMGAFLLLCGDVRVGVDQGARFQANEVRTGMTLPFFAIETCRQRLSPVGLQQTLVTATPFTPLQALAIGFLDELATPDAVLAAARIRAEDMLTLHPQAFAASKLRVKRSTLATLQAAIAEDVAGWQALLAA